MFSSCVFLLFNIAYSIYSQLLLFVVVMFCRVNENTELVNTELLFLGEI